MSHIPETSLHGSQNRAADLSIDVATAAVPGDLSGIIFRVGTVIEKTALTAIAGGAGLLIDLTLTAADLDVAVGVYRWECLATIAGQPRTLAFGDFTVSEEPTA